MTAKETPRGTEKRCPVSIVTDFGTADPYVGIMKGVMLTINSQAVLVDVSHDVSPGAIREGAFILGASWPFFPPGTVHLAVVDPGVGTGRAPVVLAAGGHFFVGPDNGLFTLLLDAFPGASAWRLEAGAYRLPRVSATFHGRDLFAPAAAWLSRGVPPSAFGSRIPSLVRLPRAVPEPIPGGLEGAICHVDRFGNLVTNIEAGVISRGRWTVRLAGETMALHRTYGDVASGRFLALIGSFGYLEVSVNGGSAAGRLGVGVGERVVLAQESQD